MKRGRIDRFNTARPRTVRAASVVLLAGLLVAPALPASGQIGIRIQLPSFKGRTSPLAAALAKEVKEVQQRFDRGRRALPTVSGPGGLSHPRQAMVDLVAATERDLGQAIARVGEPGLVALSHWAAEELRRVRQEIEGSISHAGAPLFGPRAVAVVASLGGIGYPLAGEAVVRLASRDQGGIPAARSNQLLDQVGAVIGRIFVLAKKDDLAVKLWVGSTPAPQATFRFWPQGAVKGAQGGPTIVQTNGTRDKVLRGLYSYSAALGDGPVKELVEYPARPGSPAAQLGSERLDLVNGSRFFCCRFGEKYCHHVDSEKDCRAGGR